MLTDSKNIKIGFYRGVIATPQNATTINPIGYVFSQISLGALPTPSVPIGNHISRELRNITRSVQTSGFLGIFAKIQFNDLPSVAQPAGRERDLELSDEEGLLEKFYFLYVPEFNILVCQVYNTSNQLGNYLASVYPENFDGKAVSFSPVIQQAVWDRVMDGNALLKSVEIKVARPTHPDMIPDDQWSQSMMGMFQSTDSAVLTVKIAAELRKRKDSGISLPSAIKSSVREWIEGPSDVKRARLELSNSDQPVDLLKDRLISQKDVSMRGRYLSQLGMYQALEEAYRENEEEIRRCFESSH